MCAAKCQPMREYDVLVVGGGNAGCAAALAAARNGARVLLVERYGFLGGTATASMVGPWMTFHSGDDRIVGGIAQEMVERLVARGGSPGHLHDASDYVPTITPFDPEIAQGAAVRDDGREQRAAVAACLVS